MGIMLGSVQAFCLQRVLPRPWGWWLGWIASTVALWVGLCWYTLLDLDLRTLAVGSIVWGASSAMLQGAALWPLLIRAPWPARWGWLGSHGVLIVFAIVYWLPWLVNGFGIAAFWLPGLVYGTSSGYGMIMVARAGRGSAGEAGSAHR
jgi:hypothetical protein